MKEIQPYLSYCLASVAALAVSLFSIPNIIYIAKRKRLFDLPDNHRKLHKNIVPNLGGVGIFFAFFLTASLFIRPDFMKWNYIATACLVLFITGLKDDLVTISPSKKFIAQAAAAAITVVLADVRLHSLGGLFGIHELPVWLSISFSIIGCIFVTNSFNLIDGIDGLAGTIGLYIALIMGLCLAAFGHVSEAVVAFAMVGAIMGFLRSNLSPARIFMGDTGSLIIGFIISVLGILTINAYHEGGNISNIIISRPGMFVVTLSVLFIPVFDTFRVFTMRILRGRSPFSADRTHLHHYLLDLNLSHGQTVGVMLVTNVLLTVLSLGLQRLPINIAVGSLLIFMLALYSVLVYLRRHHLQLPAPKPILRRRRPRIIINDTIAIPNTVMVGNTPVHLEEAQLLTDEIHAN